jgi:hypothetical protein
VKTRRNELSVEVGPFQGIVHDASDASRLDVEPLIMASPKPLTGRAHSARIVAKLREALMSGRMLDSGELAAHAGCDARTVRNYLADATAVLGFDVERTRGPRGVVRLRARASDPGETIDAIALHLARKLLATLFPIAGTTVDRAPRQVRAQVVVAVRGAREYGEAHLRVLRRWLTAASARPRCALQLTYAGGSESGARVVWPLGIVVRDGARVYLVGIPEIAEDARTVRIFALERVRTDGVKVLDVEASGSPPPGMDAARIEDFIDVPFSMFPARHADEVRVHVRFDAAQARHIEGRRWHRSQHVRHCADGTLDVRFGPSDRGEALAWVRQWGASVRVLGDKRFVSAWKADERARRRAERMDAESTAKRTRRQW